MKNNIKLISILSIMILAGCGTKNSSSEQINTSSNSIISSSVSNNSENKNSSESMFTNDTKLLISEYVEGSGDNNRAIELYNFSNEEVNLNEYTIAHYKREYTPDSQVILSGTLKAKETFVVVTATADAELKEKADLVSEDLFFTGKGAVALMHNGKVADSLGYISLYAEYAVDTTLVRKVDYLNPRPEYDAYDWIKYATDNFKYLGNVENSVTPEELLNGPCLDDKYLDLEQYPFYYNDGNSNRGGGGAVSGSVRNNIDGDTSDLFVNGINPKDFMTSSNYYGTLNGKTWLRARYYGVDTPESGGNAGIQEFGMMAKYYTAFIQNHADVIYVQTVKDDSLLGNFGRLLAYIWADRDTLVNYETIKAGYSVSGYSYHFDMMYKDIPYESYFYNANLYARKNKLGRYGEKDPYWNYSSGKSYCETLTCGNYFENGGSILG